MLHLEKIDWTGIEEVTEVGSPKITLQDGKLFHCVRLLRWSKKNFNTVKNNIKKDSTNKKFPFPLTPEVEKKRILMATKEQLFIEKINRELDEKNIKVNDILKKIKCGISFKQLINILGSPDSIKNHPYYFYKEIAEWGTTQVYLLENEKIYKYTHNLGHGKTFNICKIE